MRTYLTLFSLVTLSLGLAIFTIVFLKDVGLGFDLYRAWISILLSFSTLISNAAVAYYFAKTGRHNGG
jgi:hypothetical protein